ncbi:MAG: hypothetical protein AVDCRST_MAG22-1124, partial [uncultured Rubrobacteraceae bacterium]
MTSALERGNVLINTERMKPCL